MNQSVSKDDMREKSNETDAKLNVIRNGRFATLLFIIGSFLTLVGYNESEKAIFEAMSDTTENGENSSSAAKAAKTEEVTSLIFLIAIAIYAINAITTFRIQLANLESGSSTEPKASSITATQGWKLIAFFNLLKVISFAGSAIGYHINAISTQ